MTKLVFLIIIAQMSLLACHTQSRESNQFRAIHLAAGSHPDMVVVVDVNSDGKPDVIAANGGSGNVSVYLGDGKGQFSQPGGSPFAAGQEPNDITTADFNGDGKIDVAVANHGVKAVTVLLGNGKGQFATAAGSPLSVASRPHPHGIAAADFNGDKKADIAVDSWGENKVLLLFGNGDGTFQLPGVKLDVGTMPYQRLRTADLNEDGNPDIVTSNFEASSLSVLSGDGHGNFTRKDLPVPPDCFALAVADVNGDHHLDIGVAHYSGQGTDKSKNALSVLLGDGKGNFAAANGSPFSTGHYPGTLACGDLNGDGIADIVLPNHEDNTLTVYFGGRTGITAAGYSPIRAGHTPNGVAVADLNRDGKGDIVVAEDEDNDLLVLLGK